jgi:transcriptional regulator with XRE-family HTH domain
MAERERAGEQRTLDAFGAAVRARRLELGMSQEDLAAACDLHRTYVGGIERGERNLSLLNIVRISRALDTGPPHLLEDVA